MVDDNVAEISGYTLEELGFEKQYSKHETFDILFTKTLQKDVKVVIFFNTHDKTWGVMTENVNEENVMPIFELEETLAIVIEMFQLGWADTFYFDKEVEQ